MVPFESGFASKIREAASHFLSRTNKEHTEVIASVAIFAVTVVVTIAVTVQEVRRLDRFKHAEPHVHQRLRTSTDIPGSALPFKNEGLIGIGGLYDNEDLIGAGDLYDNDSGDRRTFFRAHRSQHHLPDENDLAPVAISTGAGQGICEFVEGTKEVDDTQTNDSSDTPELESSSNGDITPDLVDLFDPIRLESCGIVSLPETTLVGTAIVLADRWLAEHDPVFEARLQFVHHKSGNHGSIGAISTHATPGGLSYGNGRSGGSWCKSANTEQGRSADDSTHSTKKRLRESDRSDGPDGEGSGANGGDEPPDGRSKKKCIEQLLACPYYKLQPSRYSAHNMHEMEYRGCAGRFLPNISRLKQHLHRVHARPKAYCGRFFVVFTKQAQLDQHLQSEQRCSLSAPRYQERMTDEQAVELQKKSPNNSAEENWFFIWHILFPGIPPPASPYLDEMNDSLQDFLQFFRQEAPTVLQAGYEALGAVPPLRIPVEDVTLMLDTSISRIVSEWHSGRNGSRNLQAGPQNTPEPCLPLPSTINIGYNNNTEARAIEQQRLNPPISFPEPTARDSATGARYFAPPPPFNPYGGPHIFSTSNENLLDDPSHILVNEGSMSLTKAPLILPSLDWDWNQILEDLE